MTSAKHSRTPMGQSVKLRINLNGKDVNETLYRSMIGSLFYLTTSRPDIAFTVLESVPVINLSQMNLTFIR